MDSRSNVSSSKKNEKVGATAAPKSAEKVQAQIGGVAEGLIQIIPPKTTLEILWDDYKSDREKYKKTKKAYLDHLKVSKFARLADSD